MDYVMVTFQFGSSNPIDLKLPTFVIVEELLVILHEAVGSPAGRDHILQAEPLGRILNNNRTLEEEGVTQGTLLTLV
ncbi:EsaB/YukD family protein [Paenibacillus sp. GSMTC-2017]|uniref:EsaB/YukD family protein n=1 Tax=Paenibacillus sp. GSMTC-2017 TaxID=2794350 RepID=UPI0018DA2C2C|nr:EsaB/YukD family protein [Paenibacillus sp. GSMTC-2017]MBH5320058.1 EsaB/YukD family protein [Paenibacillus sp. GSMTC-2017]